MKRLTQPIKLFLEKIDEARDNALFTFIKPYWPKSITPNHLSILRVLISTFLCLSLFYFNNDGKALVVWLFSIGALTDLLDGSVARGLNQETKLGAMLDPIADRMLIIPIAIYSLMSAHIWLLLLLLSLECINALISLYGFCKKIFIKVNIFGRIKMVLQCVVFLAILWYWPHAPYIAFIYILWLSLIILIASMGYKILELKIHPHGKN